VNDDELHRRVQRARRMLANLIRAIEREGADAAGPPGALELLLAAEMLASLVRRLQRDLGVPKESVNNARALASEVAGCDYEGSGMGRSARLERQHVDAVRAAARPDDSFTAEEREASETEAVAVILRAMGQRDA